MSLVLIITPASAMRVVGFYSEWAVYTPNYHVSDIPAHKLTHVVYDHIILTEDGRLQVHDDYAALTLADHNHKLSHAGNLAQLTELKQIYPHLSVLFSIGGWNKSSAFSDALSDPSRRRVLVENINQFVEKYQANGVVIDWRFIGLKRKNHMISRDNDADNLLALLKALRESNNNLEIAVTFPIWQQGIQRLPALEISHYVDFINLLSVDMSGYWQNSTAHASPLFSKQSASSYDSVSVNSGVQTLLEMGVPANKILLNISSMGTSWAGVTSKNSGLYQPSHSIPLGSFDLADQPTTGLLAGKDILSKLYQNNYQINWDEQAQASYLYSPTEQAGHFISFESHRSLISKMNYIQQHDLAGVGVHYLYADEFLIDEIERFLSDPSEPWISKNQTYYMAMFALFCLISFCLLWRKKRLSNRNNAQQQAQSKLVDKQSEQLRQLMDQVADLSNQQSNLDDLIQQYKNDRFLSDLLIPDQQSSKQIQHLIQTLKQQFSDLIASPALLAELHKVSSQRSKLNYIKGERGYSGLYCAQNNEPEYIYSRLRQILFYYDFLLQVHRSYLVNKEKIEYLYQDHKGKYFIKLQGNIEIPVGGRYLADLKKYQKAA